MSARDDAIAAMLATPASVRLMSGRGQPSDFGFLLDAIPGDVSARLAIERGALQPADVYDAENLARGWGSGDLYVHRATETA